MVTVCLAWEHAFTQAAATVPLSVLLRMGIALGGRNDPATMILAQLVRLGGTVGSGRQWVSWIDLEDLMGVFMRAIDDPTMSGTYHAASPEPVTNQEMMATYRALLGRRGLSSPALLATIGAPILGSSASLALTGRRVAPTRLIDHGFEFAFSNFAGTARRALDACGAFSRPS